MSAVLAAGVAAALLLSLLPVWAGASEPVEGELDEGFDDSIRLLDQTIEGLPGPVLGSEDPDVPDHGLAARTMFVWQRGQRGYQMRIDRGAITTWETLPGPEHPTEVVSYDLISGERVAQTRLPNHIVWGWRGVHKSYVGAVDEEGGRLFLARGQPGNIPPQSPDTNPESAECYTSRGASISCLAGLLVLDAETLEVTGDVDLPALSLDGMVLAPRLQALSYAPPRVEGESGKVLALVVDAVRPGDLVNPGTPWYVLQFDPDQGVLDWLVRLDGCRAPGHEIGGPEVKDKVLDSPAVVFRNLDVADPAVWAGCYSTGKEAVIHRVPLDGDGFPLGTGPMGLPVGAGDPAAALVRVSEQGLDAEPAADEFVQVGSPVESLPGPQNVWEMRADPVSQRIVLRVIDGQPEADVRWVFDGLTREYVGTIGIGAPPLTGDLQNKIASGLDPVSGRLYVMVPTDEGGLFVADIRRNPVPQAVRFPQFASVASPVRNDFSVAVLPMDDGSRRVFFRGGGGHSAGPADRQWRVFEDRLPVTTDSPLDLFEGRTLDLEEAEGVTEASFDGAARGYAARVLFVEGVDKTARAGPLDPVAVMDQVLGTTVPLGTQLILGLDDISVRAQVPDTECRNVNRQVVVGFVGPRDPAVVDGQGSRGGVQPLLVDSGTRADSELPLSRCLPADWEQTWDEVPLVSRPLADEPGVPWLLAEEDIHCTQPGEDERDHWGDPVLSAVSGAVDCSSGRSEGWARAQGVEIDGVQIAEAASSFRIYRDPDRGIVSRVESVLRGVNIDGAVRIDTLRGVAESWANGRANQGGFDAELERRLGLTGDDDEQEDAEVEEPSGGNEAAEDFNPDNCDFTRTAGTCFQRHLFGVSTPFYECGPCGDEHALVEAMDRALGANARVRLRDPDPMLARGAPNGYIAAIQKPDHERFSDLVLNDDLLQTVVPTLEIVRFAPSNSIGGESKPGRQIIQLGGVEVSSSYGIECLLEYDAEANTCAEPAERPASLIVELVDGDGGPLAGGTFEVRAHDDGEGGLALVDALVDEGVCVTGADGVGDCQFNDLAPGAYTVSQVTAPPGYAVTDEPFPAVLGSGDDLTVTFTNTPDFSVIDMLVTDPDGTPLAGAQFAVLPVGDDGTVGTEPVATCGTDASGICAMQVPPGAYVLRQTGVPDGFAAIDDIPFEITMAGQTATVELVLGVAGAQPETMTEPPPPAFAPVMSQPAAIPPTARASGSPAVNQPPPQVASPLDQVGQTIVRVIRAPAQAFALLTRSPVEAASFAGVWLLLGLAVMAIARRRKALALFEQPI